MVQLRKYQTEAVQSVWDYFTGKAGNPLIVLPTGAGKSLTLSSFIHRAIDEYPETNILVLTHQKELIDQDARAIIRYWPEAPIGIYSAGIGKKQREQITVAGIQSVHRLPAKFGTTDIIIIDEAHLLSKKADTMYGRFIAGIKKHNPYLKVLGLTATPYRMDSGLLIEGDERIFTDICYEAHVGDLIKDGYLSPLVAKNGATKADLSAVHTRGGEFVESDLQAAMDKDELVVGALREIFQYAHDREHILGFTAGIAHAQHCAEVARSMGATAAYVSGEMGKREREAVLADFQAGRYRFLFNAMLLTTGFDYPGIDCIAMLRPTKSVGLYVQIMGRGLRPIYAPGMSLADTDGRLAAISKGQKPNCLVLDFAGNVERHGPIDQIRIKRKRAKDEDAISVAPVRECPDCHELVHPSVNPCPGCGYEWPVKASHGTEAADAVIVAALEQPRVVTVDRVEYSVHRKTGKPDSIKVTYYCGISTYQEWIPLLDERSFVRKHAVSWCWKRGQMAPDTIENFKLLVQTDRLPTPSAITVKMDGKYWRVVDCDMTFLRKIPARFVSNSLMEEAF